VGVRGRRMEDEEKISRGIGPELRAREEATSPVKHRSRYRASYLRVTPPTLLGMALGKRPCSNSFERKPCSG
jgi:hypothetical protein